MSFIKVDESLPGITALFAFSPQTAKPMQELAEALLRPEDKPGRLTRAEREIIAAYISFKNRCWFCHFSHAAIASVYLNFELNYLKIECNEKFHHLLYLADLVRENQKIDPADINFAKGLGATDFEIHDTVLIAASFSMFNRYVDGLNAPMPPQEEFEKIGQCLAAQGYL